MTTFTVSGPGVDRTAPCVGAAVIVAQRHAEQARDEATYYVRENGERAVCHVERDARGVVWTKPNGSEE